MSSSAASAVGRTVLITGGNRGIGFAVIQQLIRTHPDYTILLGARSSDKCTEAIKKLGDEATNVKAIVIDIDHAESIHKAAKDVKEKYQGVDVLVNNAAIDQSTAEKTFHTNVDGILEMISAFKPVLRRDASILNMSSADSVDAINSFPKKLRDKWLDPELTIDGLQALSTEYIELEDSGKARAAGYKAPIYAVSKVAVSVLTKILSKEQSNGVKINSACPGWCRTDMGTSSAPRSIEKGADNIAWIITQPHERLGNGEFFEDKKISSFTRESRPYSP